MTVGKTQVARGWARRWTVALLVLWLGGTVGGYAQGRRGVTPADPDVADGASPAELQRLFEAYALVQAQEVLQLTDAQYPEFLSRLRALQAVRRRYQAERMRVVQDLRRLADRGRTDGAARDRIGERLKALREMETQSASDVLQAVDRLDDVLDPVQRARLRVLEEQIERRKLELLLRARQGARARRPLR